MSQELVITTAGAIFLLSWFAAPSLLRTPWSLHRSGLAALVPSAVVLSWGGMLSGQQAVGFGLLISILALCLESGWDSAQDIGYKGRISALQSGVQAFLVNLIICLCLLAGVYQFLQFLGAWGGRWTLGIPHWLADTLALPFRFLMP